ncbi:Uncharacterized protein APZ42_023221 [Daphnia magna]|uniref:Uncharacterized protein n=1 Tax=Daphnia magna TaxID=35525 RepID=A0A164V4H4_9CRUS|nr:Uncharacterized protein APZ42_023221 [Daphnia magna]
MCFIGSVQRGMTLEFFVRFKNKNRKQKPPLPLYPLLRQWQAAARYTTTGDAELMRHVVRS